MFDLKKVARVINELCMKKARVIYQDTHVSGHACEEEIKLIYSLVRPKYSIPVHGEYRHRLEQRNIAELVGMSSDNILIAGTGDVISVSDGSIAITGHVQAGPVMVDGLSVGDVGNAVIRDRQNLSQSGIIVVSVAMNRESGEIISGPEIVSRGFVYVRDCDELMEDARNVVSDTLTELKGTKKCSISTVKNRIREDLSDYIWRRMKRSPVILTMVLEV